MSISATPRRRVVWLYDGPHMIHPFIRLGVDTLLGAGYRVAVFDRATQQAHGAYLHRPLGWPLPHLSEDEPGAQPLAPAPGPTVAPGSARSLGVRMAAPLLRTATSPWLRSRFKDASFLVSVFAHTLLFRPDVILATLPTVATVGWLAARLVGARLVYYPFELYDEKRIPDSQFWARMERRLLQRGVDAVITQNEMRARIYTAERGARVQPVLVHNYKPARSARPTGKLRQLLGLGENVRIVLYEGHLIEGRWLDCLAQAAAFLEDDQVLVFMGSPTPWWQQRVQPLLQQATLKKKVRLAPWVQPEELLDYVADADVGVVIYDDVARNNYFCEPGKLSDYVTAGLPVVAPDFPTIGPVIERYGIGRTFNSAEPACIASVIQEVLSQPKAAWQPALADARRELTWETQQPKFLAAVAGDPER